LKQQLASHSYYMVIMGTFGSQPYIPWRVWRHLSRGGRNRRRSHGRIYNGKAYGCHVQTPNQTAAIFWWRAEPEAAGCGGEANTPYMILLLQTF
jgi:hypothetical protein